MKAAPPVALELPRIPSPVHKLLLAAALRRAVTADKLATWIICGALMHGNVDRLISGWDDADVADAAKALRKSDDARGDGAAQPAQV